MYAATDDLKEMKGYCKLKEEELDCTLQSSVSQPPGRGPVLGPGINYTGPREA